MVIGLMSVLGLVLGSFLNAYIWRLKNNRSVWQGRSICTVCQTKLTAFELIPVLSFFIQKGRCRTCLEKISWQYPLVELALAALFGLITYHYFGFDWPSSGFDAVSWVRDLFLAGALLAIFVFDLRYYLIPDQFSLPAIGVAFLANLYLGFELGNLIAAMAVGLVFFGGQFFFSGGRWVGGGDIRLGVLMGAALGWPNILAALFLAYLAGSVWSVILLIKGTKTWGSHIPFGPFLAASTLFCLFWGDFLVGKYLSLI